MPSTQAPRLRPSLLFPIALGLAGQARGDLIQYEYSGVVTSADPTTGVPVGDRFTGTFAYDPAEPASQSQAVAGSKFSYLGQAFQGVGTPDASELTGALAGDPAAGHSQHGGLAVSVADGGSSSELRISSADFYDLPLDSLSLDFKNSGRSLYPSLGPPSALNLADFTSATFQFSSQLLAGGPPSVGVPPFLYGTIRGTIDSLAPVPTPEPSAAIPLGVAAAGYLIRRRGRRA